MNDDTNLDLLDLDNEGTDSLPEVAFTSPRPKKPWLLLGVALVVIALAVYIIVRTVSGPSSSSVEIDLDSEPEVVVDGGDMSMPMPPRPDMNPQPLQVPDNAAVAPKPMPVVVAPAPAPVEVKPVNEPEPNVRVVEDRRDVVFNPNKVEEKPVAKPVVAKPVAKTTTPAKPVSKPAAKKQAVTSANTWYVQFGSYATRDAANAAGKKMRAAHSSLFSGKQFVVLASQLKDGRTTYRLRVAFNNSSDANGFCRNAKSDGLDCYVAK